MFCTNCGREIDNNANACPYCGAPQMAPMNNGNPENNMEYNNNYNNYNNNYNNGYNNGYNAPQNNDNGNFGWSVLGCCFPIVGLILFLVWKNEKPNNAKKAGLGALIGFVVGILFYVLSFMIGMMGSMATYY